MGTVVVCDLLPSSGRNGNILHNEDRTGYLIWSSRIFPAQAGWICELNVLNPKIIWLKVIRIHFKWPKCHIALSLVEKNIKITLKPVSSWKQNKISKLWVTGVRSCGLYFCPLRNICVFWMWTWVVLQHIQVWALLSLAGLLQDHSWGQCQQRTWSLGTCKGTVACW